MSYDYDILGRVTSQIDPNGNITGYRYDDLGRTIEIINSDGTSKDTSYNDEENSLIVTDENGNRIECDYDEFGNILTVTNLSSEDIVSSYKYDTVYVKGVNDPSVLLDAKSMNKWLRTEKLVKDDIDYDAFCYIPGDFTASLSYYNKLVTDMNKGLIYDNKDYNLVTRNCTEETMNGLMKGKLSNGTSVGDYF